MIHHIIDHFRKFISRKLLGFEKWFTPHFLTHGHKKKMSAFLFPFSTLLVNIFHAEDLERFFNDHPLRCMSHKYQTHVTQSDFRDIQKLKCRPSNFKHCNYVESVGLAEYLCPT